MNTRQKWPKWVGVVVLVALASAFTAGFVGAVPGIPYLVASRSGQIASNALPARAVETGWGRFLQYIAGQALVERNTDTEASLSGLNSRNDSVQYLAALEQMEGERTTTFATSPASVVYSPDVIEQYLAALDQMWNTTITQPLTTAPVSAVNSWDAFEQYLEHSQNFEALNQTERERTTTFVSARHLAALKEVEQNHNWDRFDEQYLAVLDQMGNAVMTQPLATAPVSAVNSWDAFEQYLEHSQ